MKAERDGKGQRLLSELELWEVSLVTFPMLPEARVAAKGDSLEADIWAELAAVFDDARLSRQPGALKSQRIPGGWAGADVRLKCAGKCLPLSRPT